MIKSIDDLLKEENETLSVTPRLYAITFNSSHSPLTGISIYPTCSSSQVPTRGYIKIEKYETFYCLGVTAATDTTTRNQSPSVRITDPKKNISFTGQAGSVPLSDFVDILDVFSPGSGGEGVKKVFPLKHVFAPHSNIVIECLNSGVGGDRIIQMLFFGYGFRDKDFY